ncbi:glycoside hydrolase family 2 protein [Macrolepiota fuliginosa MF-IS2]|uniref:Glycoside hydrolase family 2 protein n=1 Tax=Macrolepiota fuliginosa MF-IS2 TaxID=1400762 RepID=A0A9P5XGF4_9AGAR|nr:glycoside hydrolase family 2 protein [Macrolepiota fuliginosa MF-IS2]
MISVMSGRTSSSPVAYPAYDEFVTNVSIEAEQNVKCSNHRPCVALLYGNNGNYREILLWREHPDLPARKFYEEIFPQTIERLTDSPVPYHRGSLYGGEGWNAADQSIGDVHV